MISTFKSSNSYDQSHISNKKAENPNSNYLNIHQKQQFKKSGSDNTSTDVFNKINNFLYADDQNPTPKYQMYSNVAKTNKQNDNDDEIFTLGDIPFQQQVFVSEGNNANIEKEDDQLHDNSEENTNINENRPYTGTKPGIATIDAKNKC